MSICAMCAKRGKTWEGSDPICGFRDGAFKRDWNCATVGALRQLIDLRYYDTELPEVSWGACDDQHYVTINISRMDFSHYESWPLALWVTWYKSRGATEQMWMLCEGDDAPFAPTEQDILTIVRELSASHPLTQEKKL